MGSRIMHALIANRIIDILHIKDRTSFLIGGIAPDAVTPKEASHFFTGDVMDYSRSIDFYGFIYKYNHVKNSEYILGYYTHLIADDIWLKGFYLPWLRNRMDHDPKVYNQYHHDFHLLNAKLLNYYNVAEELREHLSSKSAIIDLEEVSSADVVEFLPHVISDMDYTNNDLESPLQVFTFDQIIGYIETSVERGVLHIKQL
ncbi:hydrolase [Cytobacillus sp. FJAT-54145]|uniref:Hydrolase n=1 Tax=Cytobacillus spartinae TaxID=3299023 RepID=A0ABW6K7G7_9BACI